MCINYPSAAYIINSSSPSLSLIGRCASFLCINFRGASVLKPACPCSSPPTHLQKRVDFMTTELVDDSPSDFEEFCEAILGESSSPTAATSTPSPRHFVQTASAFRHAVEMAIKHDLPLPSLIKPSPGTLRGTAFALDHLSDKFPLGAHLVEKLLPPFGNCYQFCSLGLAVHQIKSFLMSAPTANACGFTETGARGWIYSCASCPDCQIAGDHLPQHLLLILVIFVNTMVSETGPLYVDTIASHMSRIVTQCRLKRLGPYTLTIPTELRLQLGWIIIGLRNQHGVPDPNIQWSIHQTRPKPLPIQSRGFISKGT